MSQFFSKIRQFFSKKGRNKVAPCEQEQNHSVIEDDFVALSQAEKDEAVFLEQKRQEGARTEFLSRISYHLADPKRREAALKTLEKAGYHAYKLGPKKMRDEQGVYVYAIGSSNPDEPVYIACRGTELTDASVIRDLDPKGPGYSVIQSYKEEILSDIAEIQAQYPGRSLTLCGHSLGGSLAQLIGAEILKEKAQPDSDKFQTLQSLSFSVFQSAWVSDTVIQEATEATQCIHENEPDFRVNMTAHVKQGDIVSRTGGTLFADVAEDIAHVALDMRPLDKPCLKARDYISMGLSLAMSACHPITALSSCVGIVLSRFVRNRLEAHTDRLFNESEITQPEVWGDMADLKCHKPVGTYGLYLNHNEEDRVRITHVFNKNDRKFVPYHEEISEAVYQATEELTSDHVAQAVGFSVAFVGATSLARQSAQGDFLGVAASLYDNRDAIGAICQRFRSQASA